MVRPTTFGAYIKKLRNIKGFGQRELARLMEISPSYLNDIENDKRLAPPEPLLREFSKILDACEEELFDLASLSRNDIAADVAELVRDSPETVALLRTIRNYKPSEAVIKNIRAKIEESNTRAIIIAAGLGSRMGSHTQDKPKCMLEFGNQTLLQRQMATYRSCGITDISVIRGYMKEKITYDNVRYFENPDYTKNNILNSLFYAEAALNGHVICAYSDILFEKHVVERVLDSDHDISIVVDIDWQGNYVGRKNHPVEEAESVILDANNNVLEIGKIFTSKTDVHGEFIGMMKLTPRGAELFKRHFYRAKEAFVGKPFQRAQTFEKAYLTDMIQEMVDLGVPIHSVIIERGWREIDTIEDYENALRELVE